MAKVDIKGLSVSSDNMTTNERSGILFLSGSILRVHLVFVGNVFF